MDAVKQSNTFSDLSKLSALRQRLEVLRTGRWIPLWVDSGASHEDDGIFAFARASQDGSAFAVVVLNASDVPRITGADGGGMKLPNTLKTSGKILRPVLTIGTGVSISTIVDAAGVLRLNVPPSSLIIYEAAPVVVSQESSPADGNGKLRSP